MNEEEIGLPSGRLPSVDSSRFTQSRFGSCKARACPFAETPSPRRFNDSTSNRSSLGRCHFPPALPRRPRQAAAEPCLHIKKAFQADDLARFIQAHQLAHPPTPPKVVAHVDISHHPVTPHQPP